MRFVGDALLALATGFAVTIVVASTGQHHLLTVLWIGLGATVFVLVLLLWADWKRAWLGDRSRRLVALSPIAWRGFHTRRETGHEQPSDGHRSFSTDKLRNDLNAIKRTVEDEGFGDLFAERTSPSMVEKERSDLLTRGHAILAEFALSSRSPMALATNIAGYVTGYPTALKFVQDGQAFVSRLLPGRADPGLIRAYDTAEEAKEAVRATIDAIGNVGHDLKQWRGDATA